MRWAEFVVCVGDRTGSHKVLAGTPEEKRPLGRPGNRWIDDIKIDFQEVGVGGMDLIALA